MKRGIAAGLSVPVGVSAMSPDVIATARLHQELIAALKEYAKGARSRLEATMAVYAGIARERAIAETQRENFAKTWPDAYRRVRPEARESWLMACNPIQRNQIARDMDVQPSGDAHLTITAILLKTEEWIKRREVEMTDPVEVSFRNMTFAKSDVLLMPYMGEERRGEKEYKQLVMAVWAETHGGVGSEADPNPIFRSGMTDFLAAMQRESGFGVNMARFLYPMRRPAHWESVYLEYLAVWKCLVDDEALFPSHYSFFGTSSEARAATEGRIRQALLDRWQASDLFVRGYVRRRFAAWGEGFNESVQGDIEDVVSNLPDQAAQYAALRFICGYHSPEGILALLAESPSLCRDAVMGGSYTKACFGSCEEIIECREDCVLYGNCDAWTDWVVDFRENTELINIIGEEEEEVEKPKPNVILCGACPYAEPTCGSAKQRFKPVRADIMGCAIARVRGVEPEPCYPDSECRFEKTPADLGFGYEKVRKRDGDVYAAPTGHVEATDLANHIAVLKEELANGKKF
jgi:hypothetical protein